MLTADAGFDAQSTLRRVNLRRALQLVFQHPGSQTRAGIARSTGLTPATASSLVAELIDNRFVVEGAQAASTGGKRATTLGIDARHHLLLTVIVHRDEAVATMISLDGAIVDQAHIAFDRERAADALAELAQEWAAPFGARLLAASVQLPGATDGRIVLESVQLGWRNEALADRLEKIIDAPVMLVNDVDAEAIAEAAVGGERQGRQLFVHLGVGVGATVLLDGDIAPGPRARAGEIGHVQVVFGDTASRCSCGLTGCLESACSIAVMLGEEFTEGMTVADAAALAAAAAPQRLADGAVALARAVKLLAAMLDPAEVVLGGSAAVLGEPFLDLLRPEIAYDARGTTGVSVRFAHPQSAAHLGAAQYALTAALGVRWGASVG